MKITGRSSLTKEYEERILDQIILSFEHYALGDINFNANARKKKPIASFILCTCFIDQLSGFIYDIESSQKRFERFIKDYMAHYKPFELCDTLRNGLVHNYSTHGYYRLSYNKKRYTKKKRLHAVYDLNLYDFIREITDAFAKIKMEMKLKGQMRTNVLNWYFKYQILEFQSVDFTVYDKESCKILIPHYLELMKGLPLKGIKDLKVNNIIKEKYKDIGFQLKVIAEYEGEQYFAELVEAAREFNLESPQSFLTRLHSHA